MRQICNLDNSVRFRAEAQKDGIMDDVHIWCRLVPPANANIAQLVEHQFSKLGVVRSFLIIRSHCPLVYRLLHPVLVRISGVRFPGGQLKFLIMYLYFHIICIIYCYYQLIKKYRKLSNPGMIGVSPGLDTIMVLVLAPALAVVDLSMTWIRMYREAEEAKRRQEKQIL